MEGELWNAFGVDEVEVVLFAAIAGEDDDGRVFIAIEIRAGIDARIGFVRGFDFGIEAIIARLVIDFLIDVEAFFLKGIK